jgi:TolB-like protein/Tfp pilus assembly protein PilF/predicted Ser/Thr protein kinase
MAETYQVQEGECAGHVPVMIRVIRICRNCGSKIFSDAPEGLCTGCVLEAAIGNLPAAVAGGGDPGDVDKPAGAAAKSERAAELLGELGDYELLEEIGRGGQGVVFRARQKSLNRTVALKVIGLGQWASKAHLKRFRREAEAAASLEHPGIVPIHEVGERDGSCYFSMKFVEGGQLDEIVRRKPVPIRQAVELITKIARTVHYAHEHGILHRDIKPGNILLDAKSEPHLTDFGLARLLETESTVTRTLEVLGTPSYMAPEQALGENAAVSKATDVYGLGAVLYKLLTGQPPFAGGTTYETIKLLLDTEPRPPRQLNPKIDRDLSTICLKCLEKDPQRRYSSALALAEDLERWLKHEPIRAKRSGVFTHARKWVRRNPSTAALVTLLVTLAAGLSVTLWKHKPAVLIPKSIAALPFENLSDDPANTYFAEGIQEEILTRLATIADLKVISRTSTQSYQSKPRNLSQIAKQLGVANILEGSVQKAADQVRVNVQLIDAQTESHLWADTYDRKLTDIFDVESEIAQAVANELQVKISAGEKAAIEQQPTKDIAAYDLYVRATLLIDKAVYQEDQVQAKDYFQAVDLLNQAVARDPGFLLAYCRLAEAHDEVYFHGVDRTPNRLALARAAIDAAFQLKPDSGEAHLALAAHFYHGYFDYDRARDELAIALRTLPNNARIFEWSGYIDRRQNRWHDAVRNFERAMELDPRNVRILAGAAVTYWSMRDYAQALAIVDRIIALEPKNIRYRFWRARIEAHKHANIRPQQALLEKVFDDPALLRTNASDCFLVALWARNPVAADRALAAITGNRFSPRDPVDFTRTYAQGLVARMKGDEDGARAAYSAARTEQEKVVRTQPDDFARSVELCLLGLIDAALGRKQEALTEGRRAVELLPVTKNALDGPNILYFYAVICAQVGERDLAVEQLKTLAQIPQGAHYGELRLDPFWDPLRGDPRFEKIVASLAPKGN